MAAVSGFQLQRKETKPKGQLRYSEVLLLRLGFKRRFGSLRKG